MVKKLNENLKLLTFNSKKGKLMKTLMPNFKVMLVCIATLTLSAGYCLASTVMIDDTFDVSSSGTINSQTNVVGRQSGTLAPLDYTGPGISDTEIGGLTYPGWLLMTNAAQIAPNHNFNDVGENYNIEFDIKLNRISGTTWAGYMLNFGQLDPDINNGGIGFFWWLQKNDGGMVLYSEGAVAALGNRSVFHCSEINKIEDEAIHITCVVSTKSFGGTDKVTTALFANGEPVTAQQRNGTQGYGTVFDLDQSLTNNYNVYSYNKDASVDCNVQIDNFVVRKTDPGFAVSTWTDDASSGINSSKTYTHKVNCAGSTITINGVEFTGTDSQTDNPTDPSWEYWDYHNNVGAAVIHGESTSVTGTGSGLATDYFYSRINSTLALYKLTPGQKYTLTLFNNNNATHPLDTKLVGSDSGAALSVLDQNGTDGSIFSYTYTAPANGRFSVTFDNSPVDSGDAYQNWRLYAFSNEEVVPECSLFFGFLTMAGIFIRKIKVS